VLQNRDVRSKTVCSSAQEGKDFTLEIDSIIGQLVEQLSGFLDETEKREIQCTGAHQNSDLIRLPLSAAQGALARESRSSALNHAHSASIRTRS